MKLHGLYVGKIHSEAASITILLTYNPCSFLSMAAAIFAAEALTSGRIVIQESKSAAFGGVLDRKSCAFGLLLYLLKFMEPRISRMFEGAARL